MKVDINKKELVKIVVKKTIKIGVIASIGFPNVLSAVEDIKEINEVIEYIKTLK